MGIQIITVQPRPDVTHNDTIVQLDRRRWRFSFYTNKAINGWCFDLGDVLHGIKLANGPNLLRRFRYLGDAVPQGSLWILDRGLDGRDPDLTAFADGRALLLYEETV